MRLWERKAGRARHAAKMLARALSAFTTFCVLDYIRSVLAQTQTATPRSRFVLDLREPLALVKLSPKLRISVGYRLPWSALENNLLRVSTP